MGASAVALPLAKKMKLSTGILGLKVIPNARNVLIDLYTQILSEVKAVTPFSDGDKYRSATEAMAESRLNICKNESDWEALEKRLGFGQLEELVDQARDDLVVLRRIVEAEPWKIKFKF